MNKNIPILSGLIIICLSVAVVLVKQLVLESVSDFSLTDNGIPKSNKNEAEETLVLYPRIVVPEEVFINEPTRFIDLTKGASEWIWEIAETGKKFSSRIFSMAFSSPGDYSLLLNVKSGNHSADTVFFVRVKPSKGRSPYLSDKEFASVFKKVSNNMGRENSLSDLQWNEKLVSQCGSRKTIYVQVVFDHNKSETILLEEYKENLLLAKYEFISSVSEISRNQADGSISIITVFANMKSEES